MAEVCLALAVCAFLALPQKRQNGGRAPVARGMVLAMGGGFVAGGSRGEPRNRADL